MASRNSLNFLAILDQTFLSQYRQMLVIQTIRTRDEILVPAIDTGLVAADQQDRSAPWIERVQDTVGPPRMLNPQLAHMPMLRSLHARTVREGQPRTHRFKQPHGNVDRLLLGFSQRIPPCAKLVGEFDIPGHGEL